MKFKNRDWYLVASVWVIGMAAWFALITGMGLADSYGTGAVVQLLVGGVRF